MLDNRLMLAASLYEPCETGADIGTDHALLPVWLMEQGICHRMILGDVSEKALSHARQRVLRHHLSDRTELVCSDGLRAISRPCGCISITGMGGETLSGILQNGQDCLHGAVLVLSAHTEQPIVREAIRQIGYHFTRQELCICAGRWYIVWRAEPGSAPMSDEEIRYGSMLYSSDPKVLRGWLTHRREVVQAQLQGLRQGGTPDAVRQAELDLRFYTEKLEMLS